ncbi:hypothetical protein Fmac_008783 [Flemingia macrophylla]|uniref:TORTIFOLIA1/SINE1-2 N-terminal domain-containing protein n=1 Tax=Flemingia macrophylla TaxID=520843 RepID=A0ABD1MYE3_9FABA
MRCLTKLSDRDTQGAGAAELESMARTLEPQWVPVFLSCIHSTHASDKAPVRRQCVHLVATLSHAHANALSPFLPKILANLLRRLRDPDSSVRAACPHAGAAEALKKLALAERHLLPQFKDGCLKVFEDRRFDKVKLVREVMNQMLEAWKQIPDVSDEFSPPPPSQSYSKENASDGRHPPFSQNSCSPGSVTSKLRNKSSPVSGSTPPDRRNHVARNAKRMSALSGNRTSSGVLQKLNHWDVRVAVSSVPYRGEAQQRDEAVLEISKKDKSRFFKSETKRALFDKNSDHKMHKFGGSKAGSRVVPCSEESEESGPVCNVTKDLPKNDKESEELSLIRAQLVLIEKQQSCLLDLLQKFIGSSENGMRSLESRVHGLELALDEISFDLAISSGRITKSYAPKSTCCLLPGAEFLSSKFWKKTQGHRSSYRFPRSGDTPSLAFSHYRANRNADSFRHIHRFGVHGDGSLITNPLAEIKTNSREIRSLQDQS